MEEHEERFYVCTSYSVAHSTVWQLLSEKGRGPSVRIVLYVMCGKCRKCINRYIYETSNQPKNGLSPEPRRCEWWMVLGQCSVWCGLVSWVCEQLPRWSWCRDNGSSCFSWQLRQLAAGQALGCCLSSSNNLTTATSAIRSRLGTMEPGLATFLGQHNWE